MKAVESAMAGAKREAEGWSELTLAEAGVELIDCLHKTPPAVSEGYPYVAIPQMSQGRLDLASARRINYRDFLEWTGKARPRQHDVVLSRRCNPGETAYVPGDLEFALGQNLVLLRADGSRVFPPFLRWIARSPAWWTQVQTFLNVGAVFDSLKCRDVPNFRLAFPPLREQQAIAAVLGALDDKIELNRRMNRTLEEMARAIFKSWFVDFDPVRAKAAGNQPSGLAPHIAALFPNSFTDSPLGPLPSGWEVAQLSDCVGVARGLSYNGSGLNAEGLPMHNLNSIYEGGGYKHEGIKHYTGEYKSKHIAKPGDVIVANTEQGHDRLLIGFAAIIPSLFAGESLFSHHLYRMRPSKASTLTPDYLCHLFNTPTMHGIVSGYANGTTVNMLPMDALQRPQIVVPPAPLVARFTALATAARIRCELTIAESRTLAALRDALLPKLISGELRIPDAERIVGVKT